MISKKAKRLCKEDISKIENYEQAMNDKTKTWCCHHRDEVKILPSGMTVIRSMQDLKDAGRYYGCPANELIFLTRSEHNRLHNFNKSETTRMKLSKANKGKKRSEETRRKLSKARKGKKYGPLSEEHKKKISQANKGEHNPFYGKKHSEETREKMSDSHKGKTTWNKVKTHSEEHRKKNGECK